MQDIVWMKLALEEAAKGGWGVHPNPMVGAIIVRDGQEIGRGYHRGQGQAHAEVEALRDAARRENDTQGATIYINLEPCNHFGRTPPCTDALINSGIKRCVIATRDWDPRVRGAGFARLKAAGIVVEEGLCHEEAQALNAAYFKRMRLGLPFITAKWAMSADGRTATKTGHARWISGPESREDAHRERSRHEAIIVGTQTVIDDDPQLNVRLEGNWRQPLRVILDRELRIPLTSKVFDTSEQRTMLFTDSAVKDLRAYTDLGVEIERVPTIDQGLMLDAILRILANNHSITTLYCEGGARLHGALNDLKRIDQVHIYIAPQIIGGAMARPCVAGNGVDTIDLATHFEFGGVTLLGKDIKLTGKIHTDDA